MRSFNWPLGINPPRGGREWSISGKKEKQFPRTSVSSLSESFPREAPSMPTRIAAAYAPLCTFGTLRITIAAGKHGRQWGCLPMNALLFRKFLAWNVERNWVFRHDNVFSLISVQFRCQRGSTWTALTALDETRIADGPPQFAITNLRLVLLVGTAVVGATTSTCLAPNSPGVAGTLDTTSWFLVFVGHLHLRGLKTCGVMPCPPRTTLNCLPILDKILFRLL